MPKFETAYKLLMESEFSKNPESFLHLNKNESGYTLGGAYQKWNPHAIDWEFVDNLVRLCNGDIKRASRLLYFDKETQKTVFQLFKLEYWEKNKLNLLDSQIIANDIFISATNIGNRDAIKIAQYTINIIVLKQLVNILNSIEDLELKKVVGDDYYNIESLSNIENIENIEGLKNIIDELKKYMKIVKAIFDQNNLSQNGNIFLLDDGIIGVKTINALNQYDEVDFSNLFDKMEIENYKDIADSNEDIAHNLEGWENRAEMA